jgi:two-component system, LytTR family, response regulator
MTSPIEPRPLRVIVVDDEPIGLKRLVRLASKEPRVELVGTATDGAEAVTAIRALQPDLVFLDIQMPTMTGLEVVQAIGADAMPATIFVTAYDQHAVEAFELAAVDYLVKPYDDERFEQAFRRARRMIENEGRTRVLDQLLAVLHGGGSVVTDAPATVTPDSPTGPTPAPKQPLVRIAVQMRGKLTVVQVAQIECITASGPYCELHVRGQRHLVRETIQALEDQLDPQRFLRIHRSAIVRMDLVETLVRTGSGDYEVLLKGGTRLPIGRSRRNAVQRRLGRRQ